ncbi:MAG: hypothetical protein ACIAQU_05855 [Phycisphaerales bacterium JB064]
MTEQPSTPEPPRVPPREGPPPASLIAPPIAPGEIDSKPPAWPGIIGILICVFAGLGLIQRIFGVGMAIAMPFIPLPPEMKMPDSLWMWTLIITAVGFPVSVLHLIAGIQTLRRKPSARLWVILFFVYVLIMIAPNAVLQYMTFQHQANVASQQGNSPAGMSQMMQAFGSAAMVIGIAISLAWPTFLVIWYSRSSVREHMASWAKASTRTSGVSRVGADA